MFTTTRSPSRAMSYGTILIPYDPSSPLRHMNRLIENTAVFGFVTALFPFTLFDENVLGLNRGRFRAAEPVFGLQEVSGTA
jgi:hypothetical protein